MGLGAERLNSSALAGRPSSGWLPINLHAIWEYRGLLYFLTWRDIKVRYKQTIMGITWAVIQPLLMMVIFTIFFNRLGKFPSDGLPYPIFAYTALLPWQFFSRALTVASTSLVANQHLITKVYFPRLIIPTSAVLASLVDFCFAFIVLIGMVFFYGISPTLAVLTLPLFILLALMTALGIGFWLSALDAVYRDIRHTLPFLTQLWMFATPVVYPASLVPDRWRLIYGLNPMAGVVEGFRWALLGKTGAPDPMLVISAVAVLATFIGGLYYFRSVEKTIADVV